MKLLFFNYIFGNYFIKKKFMLEKTIVPYFSKLLIVGSLKEYDSTIGCFSVAFSDRGKRVISYCF